MYLLGNVFPDQFQALLAVTGIVSRYLSAMQTFID
jgi:hypothetical protein